LIKVDNVEEGAVLRLSYKLGSAAGVLPDQHDVSGKTGASSTSRDGWGGTMQLSLHL
jgi:hypothetical protein